MHSLMPEHFRTWHPLSERWQKYLKLMPTMGSGPYQWMTSLNSWPHSTCHGEGIVSSRCHLAWTKHNISSNITWTLTFKTSTLWLMLSQTMLLFCSSQDRLRPLPVVQTQGMQPLKLFIQLYCTESHQQYENWVLYSLIFTVSMFTNQFVNKHSQNKHLSI